MFTLTYCLHIKLYCKMTVLATLYKINCQTDYWSTFYEKTQFQSINFMFSQCVAFLFFITFFQFHTIYFAPEKIYFNFDYLCSAANCTQYKIQQHIRSIFICDQRLFVFLFDCYFMSHGAWKSCSY